MDERQLTPHSASDWLPQSALADVDETVDRPGPVAIDEEPNGRARRRRSGRAGAPVGLAIVAGLAVGVLASGLLGGNSELARSAAGGGESLGEPIPSDAATAAERRLIHRGINSRGVVKIGALSPSEASVLAAAAQVRDERLDSRGAVRTEVGPDGTLSLYPIDSDDRYGYLVRVAAVGTVLVDLGNRAGRARESENRVRVAQDLRTRLGRLAAVVDGLDGSLYSRSQKLHGIVSALASRAATVVDSRRTTRIRLLGSAIGGAGRSINRELARAAQAAGAGDQARAQRLLSGVDRRLEAIGQLTP